MIQTQPLPRLRIPLGTLGEKANELPFDVFRVPRLRGGLANGSVTGTLGLTQGIAHTQALNPTCPLASEEHGEDFGVGLTCSVL